jgi:hypothetical protein
VNTRKQMAAEKATPCYVAYTWHHARPVQLGFACTTEELPSEIARALGVGVESLLRIVYCHSMHVAWSLCEEWNSRPTTAAWTSETPIF